MYNCVNDYHKSLYIYKYIYIFISFYIYLFLLFQKISEDNTSESGARIAKIWLLIGFVMGFASIIAAVWVMIDDFINNRKYRTK